MSGIDRVKEKMKKKMLSFGEFSPISEDVKESKGRKVYSLTQEDNVMLKKIFSKRLNLKSETSISTLMSEAIQLLYDKEFD